MSFSAPSGPNAHKYKFTSRCLFETPTPSHLDPSPPSAARSIVEGRGGEIEKHLRDKRVVATESLEEEMEGVGERGG